MVYVAKTTKEKRRGLRTVGLFSGIGGLELGLSEAGHSTELMVEIDRAANAVLKARFPDVENAEDVRALQSIPRGIELLAGGFPCQDLSQAGTTGGIHGVKSGLVMEVFRLAKESRVPWILLENVPFMLQLNRGEAIRHVVTELEALGYSWAYRKVDTRAFGLPQRRERIFLLASLVADPATLLFQQEVEPQIPADYRGVACGFYWTEGTRGLGWAVDAVPTLKGGSTIGIPSSPAIWMPDGRICTPDIRDGERLQGFTADWTEPAGTVGRASYRWKLVGNAVSVPAAAWIGSVLNRKPADLPRATRPLAPAGSWPDAAYGKKGARCEVSCSSWPVAYKSEPLADFLKYPPKGLSERATLGFYKRLTGGSLRYPAEFGVALERHLGIPTPAVPVSRPRSAQIALFFA
jgi:DNA (cytosine-5)-methyltransferase 1